MSVARRRRAEFPQSEGSVLRDSDVVREPVFSNLVEQLTAADPQQESGLRAVPFRVIQCLLNHAPFGLCKDVLERERESVNGFRRRLGIGQSGRLQVVR